MQTLISLESKTYTKNQIKVLKERHRFTNETGAKGNGVTRLNASNNPLDLEQTAPGSPLKKNSMHFLLRVFLAHKLVMIA